MLRDFLAGVSLLEAAMWVTGSVALFTFVRKAWPWFARFKDFLDDLMGEPERPGVKARPGVMLRLAGHDAQMAEVGNELAQIRRKVESAEYHSKPNGGGSAYDALMEEVRATRKELADHITQCGTPPVAVVVQTGDQPPAV